LAAIGPRQISDWLRSMKKPMEMIFIPNFSTGYMTSFPPADSTLGLTSSRPKIVGIDGPKMSASTSAVFMPFRASAIARLAATVDLPTPPLPDATTIMFLIPAMGSLSNKLLFSICAQIIPDIFYYVAYLCIGEHLGYTPPGNHRLGYPAVIG